ncbi:hypothetical protein LIA77_04512 [Sarocladium implicatum]|nr:hypothetical protein LIA77_04512 [Sarocladium implicatum]
MTCRGCGVCNEDAGHQKWKRPCRESWFWWSLDVEQSRETDGIDEFPVSNVEAEGGVDGTWRGLGRSAPVSDDWPPGDGSSDGAIYAGLGTDAPVPRVCSILSVCSESGANERRCLLFREPGEPRVDGNRPRCEGSHAVNQARASFGSRDLRDCQGMRHTAAVRI